MIFLFAFICCICALEINEKLLNPYIGAIGDDVFSQHVLLEIDTSDPLPDPSDVTPPRVGRDLIIILDNSGSMSGAKLEHAITSIVNIFEHLQEKDFIHFVLFNYDSSVVFKHKSVHDLEEVIRIVRDVHAHGATNLYSGLVEAEGILEEISSLRPASIRSIFLFSDGEVNAGITDTPSLVRKVSEFLELFGCSCSTFGIGEYFNERLMVTLSEQGNGQFFYIQSHTDTQKVVEIAFNVFSLLWAKSATLQISFPSSFVELKHVYGGYDFHLNKEQKNDIFIGNLMKKDKRRILLRMDISRQKLLKYLQEHENEFDLFHYSFRYFDVQQLKEVELPSKTIQMTFIDQNEEGQDLNVFLKEHENVEVLNYMKIKQLMEQKEEEISQSLLDSDDRVSASIFVEEMLQELDEELQELMNDEHNDESEDYINEIKAYGRRQKELNEMMKNEESSISSLKKKYTQNRKLNQKYSSGFEEL